MLGMQSLTGIPLVKVTRKNGAIFSTGGKEVLLEHQRPEMGVE